MDYNLPGMNGIDFHPAHPQVFRRIQWCVLHSHPAYARKMMQSGAMGYLKKLFTMKWLLRSPKYTTVNTCAMKSNAFEQMIGGQEAPTASISFPKRELDIIGYIKQGCHHVKSPKRSNISVKLGWKFIAQYPEETEPEKCGSDGQLCKTTALRPYSRVHQD